MFTACTTYVTPEPLTDFVPQGLTMDQVRTDIVDGCTERKLVLKEISDNEIEARFSKVDMWITFIIKYDTNQYTISYKDSQNLKSSDGKIHGKYLNWRNNINKSIQEELSKTKFLMK
jgi:hypothetical protein